MGLHDALPRWIAWPLRGVFWLAALPLIAVAAWLSAHVQLASHADQCLGRFNNDPGPYRALQRTRAYADCLARESGWLGGLLLRQQQRQLAAMPSTPARFVGDWIATRPGARYRISLRPDGGFDAMPQAGTSGQAMPMSGNWSALDGRLVWLYDQGQVWPPDINPVVEAVAPASAATARDPFDLIEADGSRTHYVRDMAAPSGLSAIAAP
jgi:hypothetical protein